MVEILRCPECGFRIKGFPAQYLSRRVVECLRCGMGIPLSLEDRLRLKRLIADEGEGSVRPRGGHAAA